MFNFMNAKMQSSGGDGIAYWDYENGVLVKLRQTQRLTMQITVNPNPKAEDAELKQGFGPIVHKLNTSTSIDLIEPEPASTD